ncbi:hypothetical protein ACIA8G_40835 [Lentzea sp. NPDC051213]|uniref:hypothetical protein n=1 Tax=Lentzea sp. NPDC051213 TaxID=3364126 RepID=UPI0037A4E87F
MINFHQLRAWRADGVEEREITRRLAVSDMSTDDILNAWSLAFEVSLDAANAAMQKGYEATVQYDLMRGLERLSDGELDEVGDLLRLAAAEVPSHARSGAGLSVAEVLEQIDREEWWLALDVLGEFEGVTWQTHRYWDLLAEVALQIEVEPSWYLWRRGEAVHGLIRAELTLDPAAEAVPAQGTRPVWQHSDGERRVAAMWVEQKQALAPGAQATARLRPFLPDAWNHLTPGDQIVFQQYGEPMGTAKIIEKVPPRP